MRWPAAIAGLLLAAILAGPVTAQSPYADVPAPVDTAACTETGDWAVRALARSLSPPLGLPAVPHPEANPPTVEKIELGRKLFFDRRLSINKTMSCAMCHVPEQAFANWELQTAVGVEGRSGKRNAPTILNSAYYEALFHDGRDPALETQFLAPLLARNEMANPAAGGVVALLNRLPEYRAMFLAAFGALASLDRMGMALGAYQRSVLAANAPFDRWAFGGEEGALSAAEKNGFALFTGKAGCASCHPVGDRDALFTDQQFHDTGYGWMREQARQRPAAATRVQVAPGVFYDVARATVAAVGQGRAADLGRYEVTEDPADRWRFRTPGLRNVAVTRPYMHDGALPDLAAVIAFYNAGGPDHPEQDPRIHPLGLTPAEMADLAAFLGALTSPDLACLAAEARSLPPDNH